MSATQPLSLWLTSRSAVEEGFRCARQRYLHQHAGPHGYGWERKAQSIPTVTGTLVHAPLTAIMAYVRDHDQVPNHAWIATEAIAPAIRQYHQMVETRGLSAISDPDELQLRVAEQVTLLEALVWTWVLGPLPAYVAEHRVVLVEEEYVSVLGCTCGLGDLIGRAEDHDARACAGIGWMTRGDWIGQSRLTGTYRYDEVKTTADPSKNWTEQWKYRVQLVAGVLGAEQALGASIDAVYIHALRKGKRQAEWNPEEGKASGPKYQLSPLVYGGRRAANPPLWDETWDPKWGGQYFLDQATGKRKRQPKDFVRTGVWELPTSVWAHEGISSPVEFWVKWLAASGVVGEQYLCVGPIYREDWALGRFTRQLVANEVRWENALHQIYRAAQGETGQSVAEALDEHIPQNRGEACQSFYGETCPYAVVCDAAPGMEPDMAASGFVARRPHHRPELDQAVSRGLLPPDVGAADEGED